MPRTAQQAGGNGSYARTTSPIRGGSEAFSHLDLALARNYGPLAAYGYLNHIDYFAAHLAGQTYQPVYGIDLTRLYRVGRGR